jgi:hypothetical protein
MINWKRLSKSIPDKVQVGRQSYYTVLHVEKCPSGDYTAGECDPNSKTIFIRTGQSPRQKTLTYLHELCHAFSFEAELELTEAQVSDIETKILYYVLKKDNVFK